MKPYRPQDIHGEIDAWNAFSFSYSYFGRVENWLPGEATRPQDLTETEPKSDRLLMSDQLFHWWATDGWAYNHGEKGSRNAGQPNLETGRPYTLAGLNQLYGDGRVVWKAGALMNRGAINPANPNIGMVRAYATDSTFY